MESTIESSNLNFPHDSWSDYEEEETNYLELENDSIRKYVIKICNKKIDESLKNTLDSYSNIDKYSLISKIIVKLTSLNDINYLLKKINVNFWVLCLESLENIISQIHTTFYQDTDKCENTLRNLEIILNIYSTRIFDLYSISDFCKSHKLFIIDIIKKIEYINYNYNENIYYINNILQKFMNNCFNIEIWESYLKLNLVKETILDYLDNPQFIWIFYQITIDTTIELFEYYLNVNITENNNGTKNIDNKKLSKFTRLFKILFNKYKTTDKMTYFININIHKIVGFKDSLKMIKLIHNHYNSVELFKSKDSYGYYPFLDCIRYCDVITVRWFIKNIFSDINSNTLHLDECILNNDIIQYAMNNSDKKVIVELLNLFKKINIDFSQIFNYTICFNIETTNSIDDYKPIKNIYFKLQKLFDFSKNLGKVTLSFMNSIFNIELFSNFKNDHDQIMDFKISILDQLLEHQKQFEYKFNLDCYYLDSNMTICKIFKLHNYNKKNVLFIKKLWQCFTPIPNIYKINKVIYYSILQQCCFCEIEDIVNYIYEYNLGYDKTITYDQILNILQRFSNYNNISSSSNILFSIHSNYKTCGCNKQCDCDLLHFSKKILNYDGMMYCYSTENYNSFIQSYKNNNFKKQLELLLLTNQFYNTRYKLLDNFKDSKIKSHLSSIINYGNPINSLKTDLLNTRKTLNLIVYEIYVLSRLYTKQQTTCKNRDISNKNIPILTIQYYNTLNHQIQNKIHSRDLLSKNITTFKDIQNKLDKLNKIKSDILLNISIYKIILANHTILRFILLRKIKYFTEHKQNYINCIKSIKYYTLDNSLFKLSTHKLQFRNLMITNLSSIENNYTNQITIPQLFTAKDMVNNYATHTTFTEKIDGVTRRNIILKNSFPKFPNNTYLSTEYLEKDKMHFIISLSNNNFKNNKNFIKYIDYLRSIHTYTKTNVIQSTIDITSKDIVLFIRQFKIFKSKELENYEKYKKIQQHPNNKGKIFWWPKKFFEIKCPNIQSYISFMKLLSEDVFHIFDNDGWIIQHKNYSHDKDLITQRTHSFKYKPTNLMTIDLQYRNDEWLMANGKKYNITDMSIPEDIEFKIKDGDIYRCYPIISSHQQITHSCIRYFEPREKRFDKKTPNPENIVVNIINEINNPFDHDDLINFIDTRAVYYSNEDSCCNTLLRYNLSDYSECFKYIKGKVFDLGGGYATNKHLKHANVDEYHFGDIDIKCLINSKVKSTFMDFNKKIKDYTQLENVFCNSELLLNKYESLLMINCINFAINSNNISDYLDNFSKKKTKLIIRFMDADLFESYIDRDDITIKCSYNSSYIQYNSKQRINKIYYSWVHSIPINESLVGYKYLQSRFEYLGWKPICYEKHPKLKNIQNSKSSLDLWDLYFKCFSCVVFEKM